jgi:hypothetical protein
MRGDENFVQSLQLFDAKMRLLAKLEGSFNTGQTSTYELNDEEIIVGCYGVYNYQPYIVGLGLITWTPANQNYSTDN